MEQSVLGDCNCNHASGHGACNLGFAASILGMAVVAVVVYVAAMGGEWDIVMQDDCSIVV